MTAEAIARVVADLRRGDVRRIYLPTRDLDALEIDGAFRVALKVANSGGPVVDATAIYRSLVAREEPVYLYEDHPCISPPWPFGSVCYENEHGNVIVMTFVAEDGEKAGIRDPRRRWAISGTQPGPWKPAEPVEWDRVRWCMDTWLWVGGRGDNGPSPTAGPAHMWRFAIYDNGEPADLHWVQLVPDYPLERWDMAHLVMLGVLNFLNCRNVDIVEPTRPRPERRRIERTGVRVHTINVFPVGKTTCSPRREGEGVALHSVRGHFASYGVEGKGLLFGKHAGRYWRPQHARGAAEHGEVEQTFVVQP